MIAFILAALLLAAFAAALLLQPLLRPAAAATTTATDKSAAILREQLDELKAEQAAGNLTATEFSEAENELKRRILEEHQRVPSAVTPPAVKPATKTAAVLALILIAGGFGLYGLLGNLLALQPEMLQSAARQVDAAAAGQQMTPEQIAGMVEKLAARLEANPDDPEGWLMLARSYKMLERPADAAAAYAHIEALVAQDADLLADYAEALAMSSATRLNGKPRQLVKQALQLEPDNRRALFLAGVAALDAGDNSDAVAYWEKLLPLVPEGGDLHNLLTEQLGKMKAGK